MSENNANAKDNKARASLNRRSLVLIAALFALPAVIATLMYLTGWRPASTGNHGILIQPARLIEDTALRTLDGKPVHFSALHGKWAMVYFGPSACPQLCMKSLYNMRQAQAAQGKESNRVERVFILTDTSAVATLKAKLLDYPGMHVWAGEKKAVLKLADNFDIHETSIAQQQGILLVDPLGNLMMRYVPESDPTGMLKDMTRLLKYSWLG